MTELTLPVEIDMIVEIPFKSNVKYELDKDINRMRCDRVINTPMYYPGNYGYIPDTLSGDGDPLDILLVTEYAIYPGTLVKIKMIGVLFTEDEKGEDEKIIAVPTENVDERFKNINNYTDLDDMTVNQIKHFFTHYKDIDKNKWVKISDLKGPTEAYEIYTQSCNNYLQKLSKNK
jgi:inorganic pyrophosphatase